MTISLTVEADVKQWLLLNGSTVKDGVITYLIPLISAEIGNHLRRERKEEERFQVFDVNLNQDVWWLPAYPIKNGATFEVRHALDGDFADTNTIVGADRYRVNESRGYIELRRHNFLSEGPQSLRIQWTGGLGTAAAAVKAVFPDISGAADEWIAHIVRNQKRTGMVSVSTGTGSISTPKSLPQMPDSVMNRLLRHVRKVSSR